MLDREDGVKKRQTERDRDKIDWLEGVIRRIQSSGHVLANVGIPVSSRPSRHGKADGTMGCSKRGMTGRKEIAKAKRYRTASRSYVKLVITLVIFSSS